MWFHLIPWERDNATSLPASACSSNFLPYAIPMVGDHGRAGKGFPPFYSSWGVKVAWGLPREEVVSLLGMRIMAEEEGMLPPEVPTAVPSMSMIRHSWGE